MVLPVADGEQGPNMFCSVRALRLGTAGHKAAALLLDCRCDSLGLRLRRLTMPYRCEGALHKGDGLLLGMVQQDLYCGAFPLRGTTRFGTAHYDTAQFGSVYVSTAV